MTRLDKLGRKIPEYDRSAAAKKGAATRREKEGHDIYSRIGARGGKHSGRGYFGKLAAEDPDKLKELQKRAKVKSAQFRKSKTEI